MPSKEILRRSRICIVPACKAVNSDYPDRIFFAVPENKKQDWLDIVGGSSSSIKSNKRLYCCEKHFDVMNCFPFLFRAIIRMVFFFNYQVQRDIEGYHFYKYFGGRIKLEDHAYPHKNLGDNITVPPPQVILKFVCCNDPTCKETFLIFVATNNYCSASTIERYRRAI